METTTAEIKHIPIHPHAYSGMSNEEREELLSQFLIDSCSYSGIEAFARNQKAFEMVYVYRNPIRMAASAIAGNAYHSALKYYFSECQKGNPKPDLAALQVVAFEEIDSTPGNKWKLQKTLPTVEECVKEATAVAVDTLQNFLKQIDIYEAELAEILAVEVYFNEFLTINGVDIPLPFHAKVDLIIKLKDGRVVIIDHKSKGKFSDDKDVKFSIGKQAITYVLCYETKFGIAVDEVWFVENKHSKNKDKSIPQLCCHEVKMDIDTRRLYEALLYEPLKCMLEATSDPNHVYMINEADNYVDKAEIHEFWCQTQMTEIGYNIPDNKKEMIRERQRKIRDTSLAHISPSVIKKFRENASEFIQYDLTNKNMSKAEKIEHTLRTLGVSVKVAHTFDGYSSDTFLLEVSAGTNISTVYRYKMDLANALDVASVRMPKDLFVYDKKSYLAIESSKQRDKDLIFDPKYLDGFKIPIGINNFGQVIFWDLKNQSTPNVLICGSVGSGKSVCIISVLEFIKLAGVNKIIIFDPKFEFVKYKALGIQVYNEIEDIERVAGELVVEMNDRIEKGVSEITAVVFDEWADAIAASRKGAALDVWDMMEDGYFANGSIKQKRVKVDTLTALSENLRVLMQKGRSSGFRVIAATQRASAKIIDGDTKVNFPIQVCFRVPKEVDSKVVIDEGGAESLAGRGDGLMKSPEYQSIQRIQAFYKPD